MNDELDIETEAEVESDPVCGATVELDQALERGLALEYEGRQYTFCGPQCRRQFEHAPLRYAVAGRSEP